MNIAFFRQFLLADNFQNVYRFPLINADGIRQRRNLPNQRPANRNVLRRGYFQMNQAPLGFPGFDNRQNIVLQLNAVILLRKGMKTGKNDIFRLIPAQRADKVLVNHQMQIQRIISCNKTI